MSSSVSIERSYLEALIQGYLSFQQPQREFNADSPNTNTVTIPKSEYQSLIQVESSFKNLKYSLLNLGVTQENIDVLIHQTGYSTPQSVQTAETANENHHPQKPTKANTITDSAPSVAEKESWHENSDIYRNAGSNGTGSYDYDYDDEDSGLNGHNETSEYDGSLEDRESSGVLEGQRVMSLRRLPLTVTHRDVIDVVRGGALLDISPFRRTLDHNMCTVRITFVEEMAAQKFFNYAKRNGIYVAGRRVEVVWDKPFHLRPLERRRIYNGATRNIVIYNVNPNITEEVIRRDLEHIHELIVISVNIRHGNAYISTNSVHKANLARTCMISRLEYKRMTISYYPDECAEPMNRIAANSKASPSNVRSKKRGPVSNITNRFQYLSMEASGEENYEDDHEELYSQSSFSG